jgi:membrane-bound ClpP family serine protease
VSTTQTKGRDVDVIVLGVILLLIGLLTGLGLLSAVGAVLLLVGAALWIMGAVGHQVGGRPHYY